MTNAILELLTKGAWQLSEKAIEVESGTTITELLNEMWKIMYKNKGIGLAANQVGVLKRVIIIHAEGLKLGVINPSVIARKGGKRTVTEGCLSFPGKKVQMRRYKRVILTGFDKDWNPIKLKLSGLVSVCAQHEVDHLNGQTIV